MGVHNSYFISPEDVLVLPKAAPRKNSNRRRGKTRIYTDTPVRDEIEKRWAQKQAKKSHGPGKNTKRKLFSKQKEAPLVVSSSSSDDENTCDDNSDCNLEERNEIK